MSVDNIPIQERLLLIMHNLGVMRPEAAKNAGELAGFLQAAIEHVTNILSKHEADGYVKSHQNQGDNKKFYLTEAGIIRVCSFFT